MRGKDKQRERERERERGGVDKNKDRYFGGQI